MLANSSSNPTYHIDRRQTVILIGGMADEQIPQKITKFRPRSDVLEARIRELASDSFNVLIPTDHCLERQEERSITDDMIYEVLRRGYISGEVRSGENPGEWKCKMTRKMKGAREVGVVTVLINNNRLLVATAEWEDQR